MNEAIELKMSEWVDRGDNVSMFKFASLLFITAPKDKEPQMQEILYQAQQIAEGMTDIEIARAKKEIQQLLTEEKKK
jgi:hypothetical protein